MDPQTAEKTATLAASTENTVLQDHQRLEGTTDENMDATGSTAMSTAGSPLASPGKEGAGADGSVKGKSAASAGKRKKSKNKNSLIPVPSTTTSPTGSAKPAENDTGFSATSHGSPTQGSPTQGLAQKSVEINHDSDWLEENLDNPNYVNSMLSQTPTDAAGDSEVDRLLESDAERILLKSSMDNSMSTQDHSRVVSEQVSNAGTNGASALQSRSQSPLAKYVTNSYELSTDGETSTRGLGRFSEDGTNDHLTNPPSFSEEDGEQTGLNMNSVLADKSHDMMNADDEENGTGYEDGIGANSLHFNLSKIHSTGEFGNDYAGNILTDNAAASILASEENSVVEHFEHDDNGNSSFVPTTNENSMILNNNTGSVVESIQSEDKQILLHNRIMGEFTKHLETTVDEQEGEFYEEDVNEDTNLSTVLEHEHSEVNPDDIGTSQIMSHSESIATESRTVSPDMKRQLINNWDSNDYQSEDNQITESAMGEYVDNTNNGSYVAESDYNHMQSRSGNTSFTQHSHELIEEHDQFELDISEEEVGYEEEADEAEEQDEEHDLAEDENAEYYEEDLPDDHESSQEEGEEVLESDFEENVDDDEEEELEEEERSGSDTEQDFEDEEEGSFISERNTNFEESEQVSVGDEEENDDFEPEYDETSEQGLEVEEEEDQEENEADEVEDGEFEEDDVDEEGEKIVVTDNMFKETDNPEFFQVMKDAIINGNFRNSKGRGAHAEVPNAVVNFFDESNEEGIFDIHDNADYGTVAHAGNYIQFDMPNDFLQQGDYYQSDASRVSLTGGKHSFQGSEYLNLDNHHTDDESSRLANNSGAVSSIASPASKSSSPASKKQRGKKIKKNLFQRRLSDVNEDISREFELDIDDIQSDDGETEGLISFNNSEIFSRTDFSEACSPQNGIVGSRSSSPFYNGIAKKKGARLLHSHTDENMDSMDNSIVDSVVISSLAAIQGDAEDDEFDEDEDINQKNDGTISKMSGNSAFEFNVPEINSEDLWNPPESDNGENAAEETPVSRWDTIVSSMTQGNKSENRQKINEFFNVTNPDGSELMNLQELESVQDEPLEESGNDQFLTSPMTNNSSKEDFQSKEDPKISLLEDKIDKLLNTQMKYFDHISHIEEEITKLRLNNARMSAMIVNNKSESSPRAYQTSDIINSQRLVSRGTSPKLVNNKSVPHTPYSSRVVVTPTHRATLPPLVPTVPNPVTAISPSKKMTHQGWESKIADIKSRISSRAEQKYQEYLLSTGKKDSRKLHREMPVSPLSNKKSISTETESFPIANRSAIKPHVQRDLYTRPMPMKTQPTLSQTLPSEKFKDNTKFSHRLEGIRKDISDLKSSIRDLMVEIPAKGNTTSSTYRRERNIDDIIEHSKATYERAVRESPQKNHESRRHDDISDFTRLLTRAVSKPAVKESRRDRHSDEYEWPSKHTMTQKKPSSARKHTHSKPSTNFIQLDEIESLRANILNMQLTNAMKKQRPTTYSKY